MYSKLFSSIVNSSIWSEDSDVRVLWVTLMAMADQRGFIFGSVSGLARITSIPIEKVLATMEKFLAPDPLSSDASRAPERGGRRIEVVDGGWRMFNYDHYNHIKDADDRRAQVREAVQRHRLKKRNQLGNQMLSSVTESNTSAHTQTHAQTHLKRKKDGVEPSKTPAPTPPVPPELGALELYRTDEKLIRQFPTLLAAWRAAYPGISVEGEIRKAHAWEVANPSMRKKNRPRFLQNWLSKSQDQGPRNGRFAVNPQSEASKHQGKWKDCTRCEGRRVVYSKVTSERTGQEHEAVSNCGACNGSGRIAQ